MTTPPTTPALRLYGHGISSNTRRVLLVLEHLGLPYELAPVNLMAQAERAQLRTLNPNGKIPVLVHGDFVLWESHAIMQYVAELAPGQALYPYPPRERADVNRWLFWHNAHFAPPLGGLGWERVWKQLVTGQGPDAAACAQHEHGFAEAAAGIDAHLAAHPYLAGDALSLADLSIAATVENAAMYRANLAPHAHLRAHHARIAQLPAWRATQPPPFAPPPPASADARTNVG